MKNPFQMPEVEVIRFEMEDVITSSSILPTVAPGMNENGDGGSDGGGSTNW